LELSLHSYLPLRRSLLGSRPEFNIGAVASKNILDLRGETSRSAHQKYRAFTNSDGLQERAPEELNFGRKSRPSHL
jgi:hypothetical protein